MADAAHMHVAAQARLEGLRRPVTEGAFLYILRCADGSYYTGTARSGLELRVAQHNAGTYDGYTARRRPVILGTSDQHRRASGPAPPRLRAMRPNQTPASNPAGSAAGRVPPARPAYSKGE